MLVLTRKTAETIHIGNEVVIKVIKARSGAVKIGISAPDSVRVLRGELVDAVASGDGPPFVSGAYAGVLSDQFPHIA